MEDSDKDLSNNIFIGTNLNLHRFDIFYVNLIVMTSWLQIILLSGIEGHLLSGALKCLQSVSTKTTTSAFSADSQKPPTMGL